MTSTELPETTTLESLLSRFETLKSKRQETVRLNKLEVSQDIRLQKLNSLQSRGKSIDADQSTRNDLDEKDRLMEYTIEECEKWQEKQQRKANNGIQDQNKLAESSYYKEISAIKIDKEAYRLSKENEIKGISPNDSPINDAKDEVSKLMKESKDRKFNKKKRGRDEADENVGNYINEKNRQFNMKLNRQYQ
ncbi:uncharacterized protein KGF55_005096 [Candida pseudojiufengensis]|uniref:uncharacterized protein n=1 Tax=Candida pseudojiufengensis TaxID=497109 RepID=UPI002225AF56|nr:uncharacterized protein KGF55_005096 [Candida pseudojiufengensis]KAI5959864.1 hypothetical protein KGF55_005096 [Candida pseudojiufengensis]